MRRIAIIGGGPGGYEAALVAAQLGADVTVIERDGLGGACVVSDCVPSKTFIATSEALVSFRGAGELGVRTGASGDATVAAPVVHDRVKVLARAQSADIRDRLLAEGVRLVAGTARFSGTQRERAAHRLDIATPDGEGESITADTVLIATGGTPRVLPGAQPDGERILTWRQVYDLPELPTHLVVVGSGVTGAEFASAYTEMGVAVTLISSRDRLLPAEDADAANLLADVFAERGMRILRHARATEVRRTADGVVVEMMDGRTVEASHALMTVGSLPNTGELGLDAIGLKPSGTGHFEVDRMSRTPVPGVYAAGDCTGVLALASVAGMQGRIAMWHALGEAVEPLRLRTVAANVFTDPEIASVGVKQAEIDSGEISARGVTLPLATNARAKMSGVHDGFVKLFCREPGAVVAGGVVVAPRASELILPLALAVRNRLTAGQVANTLSIYPSMSGSLTEAARQLMVYED